MTDTSKSKGDEGEDFVSQVASKSILRFWCYPNPCDLDKDNKEICDLLVLFQNICMIISVKNYAFSGNYQIYFKKTLGKAVRQIAGAERKLFGERAIKLKHPDRAPEIFNKSNVQTLHRIIVNVNTSVKFYEPIVLTCSSQPVFVFDRESWNSILKELNTLPDFVRYLNDKQRLLANKPCIMLPREEYDFEKTDGVQFMEYAQGLADRSEGQMSLISGSELDLLSVYIKHGLKFPDKFFSETHHSLYLKVDGGWDKYQRSEYAAEKKKYERDSEFVDYMVNQFLIKVENGDKISRALYSLDRMQRATLARRFFEMHRIQRNRKPPVQFHRINLTFDVRHFLFIYFDLSGGDTTEELLMGFIDKSLLHHHYLQGYQCEEIIAIAVSSDFEIYSFGYLTRDPELTIEEKTQLESMFKVLGWKLKS